MPAIFPSLYSSAASNDFKRQKESLCVDDRDCLYSETPETYKLYKKIEEKFLLRWTDKDFDQYLDSLPIALQATKSHQKKTFIQKQYEALVNNQHTLNFDDYSRTIKSVWLHISDEQKNFLLSEAVSATDGRLELLFTMIDFEFNSVSLFALAANYLKSD